MRLLSATPSPYARKVRVALAEKGIPFELVTEVPWNSDAAAPRHNPLGKIPVLLLDDGTSVYDSRFILEWLELKHPSPPLLPRDVEGILAHKRLEVLGDGVCDAVVLTLIERMREPAMRSAEWIARQRRKIEAGLAELERLAVPGAPFACGETFGLGDIAIVCTLGYFGPRLPELDWRPSHPKLASMFDRLSERPSFATTVPTAQTMRDKVV